MNNGYKGICPRIGASFVARRVKPNRCMTRIGKRSEEVTPPLSTASQACCMMRGQGQGVHGGGHNAKKRTPSFLNVVMMWGGLSEGKEEACRELASEVRFPYGRASLSLCACVLCCCVCIVKARDQKR